MEGGPPRFRQDYTCPALLRYFSISYSVFKYGAITHYGSTFQMILLTFLCIDEKPYNPTSKLVVWPLPLSLTATGGISFDFFSSRY